jgi:hypothetical protein
VDGCRTLADWIDDAAEFLGARAMQAAIPAPAGVRVRKLEWQTRRPHHGDGYDYVAASLVGEYLVTTCNDAVYLNSRIIKGCRGIAAAQADYERRIRSALEPAWAREGAQIPVAVMGAALQAVSDEGVFVPDPIYPSPDVPGAAFWERAYNRRTGQAIEARARATTAEADLAALRAEVERRDEALYQLANIGAGSTWYTAPSVVRKAEDIARAALPPAKAGG